MLPREADTPSFVFLRLPAFTNNSLEGCQERCCHYCCDCCVVAIIVVAVFVTSVQVNKCRACTTASLHGAWWYPSSVPPLMSPLIAPLWLMLLLLLWWYPINEVEAPPPPLWRHHTRHYIFIITDTDEIHSNPVPIPIAIVYTTFNIYRPLSLLLQLLLPWYYCFHCWVVAWMLVVVLFPAKATGASLMTL